jgi:two-component system, NarL family, invasion response regulator UvrY
MIRILLVDDHKLVRSSIKSLLNDVETIQVIGEAENGEDAIHTARELKPDIVMIDINMPGMGGFEAIYRLLKRKPTPKILILSAYTSGLVPMRLLGLGAAGFLSKRASREEMHQAIQIIYAGGRHIDSSVAEVIASFHIAAQSNPSPLLQLNERELQVLLMVVRGTGRRDIAKILHLSKKTINGYMINVLKKLRVKTDTEAVRMALESGLIDGD